MKREVRVLQFITPAGFYGAERWVLALANNLAEMDIVCDLAVTSEGPDQDLTLADLYPAHKGQQVHRLEAKGRFDVGVIRKLCQVIRSRQIDVIHTHGYKSDIIGLLAARRTGIVAVSTPHGFPGKMSFKLGVFIKAGNYALRHFDKVVPLSEELMADVRRLGVPESKTLFVRNGVDLLEIDATLQSLSSAPDAQDRVTDTKIIGFIGQLIPRKGIPDLLTVFGQLHGQDPALRLQLLGDGRQRPELEQLAAVQPGADAIEFMGFRSDRLELLSRFSLFVMTSSLEGIPRCMMEAMAVGVPVVAYDIPGVDQLVEHGKTGLLAPYGDKAALASCCRQILEDPELARTLTLNARALIDDKYSAARMAREYEQLFYDLTGRNEPSVTGHRKAG